MSKKYPDIPKPKTQLTRDLLESVELFKNSVTFVDVANVLEVHPGHLKYWLYIKPGHNGYTHFEIPKKSGGVRDISSPPKQIAILQQKLKVILDKIYKPKDCVCGFIQGRSIVDGASKHKNRPNYIFNLDIKNFYPSIHFGRVRGLFMNICKGDKAASVWAHLVTCNGVLPQGASTSPVISNMIAKPLDGKLLALAKSYNLTYTRYADDITFSAINKRNIQKLASFSNETISLTSDINISSRLSEIFKDAGFSINSQKTRIYSNSVRQEVTGLTVNVFVNVKKKFIKQIRAMIHAAKKFDFPNAGIEYINKYSPANQRKKLQNSLREEWFDPEKYFKCVLYGKIGYLKMVRGETDNCYIRFCREIAEIDDNPPKFIREIKNMNEPFDVFICHASEDKEEIATPLYNSLTDKGVKTFIDDKFIKTGDSLIEIINNALAKAELIVLIISDHSIEKNWPMAEISSTISRTISGQIRLYPIFCGTEESIAKLREKFPLLHDKLYKQWSGNPDILSEDISTILSEINT